MRKQYRLTLCDENEKTVDIIESTSYEMIDHLIKSGYPGIYYYWVFTDIPVEGPIRIFDSKNLEV
jgi:hypothetical protein